MAQRDDLGSEELLERSSEDICQDIFERRESLSNTIDRLGSRMRGKLDWREQASQHPYLAMGTAAGLGFLLSGILKPSPTPGKRMKRDPFQRLFHKTRPEIITMLSKIILQAGGDFLLAKIKKNTSDYKKNGNEFITRRQNMDKNSFKTETNKPEEGGFAPISESKRAQKSSATQSREFGSDPDLTDRAEEFYDQAKKTVSDTCNKTTETLNKTYNQAIEYGRANPGKLALLALGSGLVIGLLLANRSKARQGASLDGVVDTLSQGFSDFVRRHWG